MIPLYKCPRSTQIRRVNSMRYLKYGFASLNFVLFCHFSLFSIFNTGFQCSFCEFKSVANLSTFCSAFRKWHRTLRLIALIVYRLKCLILVTLMCYPSPYAHSSTFSLILIAPLPWLANYRESYINIYFYSQWFERMLLLWKCIQRIRWPTMSPLNNIKKQSCILPTTKLCSSHNSISCEYTLMPNLVTVMIIRWRRK